MDALGFGPSGYDCRMLDGGGGGVSTQWTASELERKRLAIEGETVLANMRRGKDDHLIKWAKADGRYMRIDHRTPYGNPFEIGVDGTREEVCAKFVKETLPSLVVPDLKGKVLCCWCYPKQCHGEALIAAQQRQLRHLASKHELSARAMK